MRKALGRGLDALIPDAEFVESVKLVDIDKIERSPFQPREEVERNIESLVESVKTHGVLEPVLVKRSGDKYILIAGERRFLAALKAGITKIPARVLDVPESVMAELALVENLLREDLNPLEEATGIQTLIEKFNYTHEKIGEILGLDRATITNKLRLLKLADPVKELLKNGAISEGHAKLLVSLDEKTQVELAELVAQKGLSVRQLESLIQKAKEKMGKTTKVRTVNMISQLVGSKVSVKIDNSGKGQIILRFKNKDEFMKLAEFLGLKPESH